MQPDEGHHPDYNFIMNPDKPARKRLLGGGDKKQRLLMMVIAGGLALMVIIFMVSSFFGGSAVNQERLVSLAQQQTELIRVAQIGQEDATDTPAKNLAATVTLSLNSARNETLKLSERKLKDQELAALKDSNTDELLADAKQAGRFDEAFLSSLQSALTTYQQELSDFFDDSSSQKEKALLQKLYKDTLVLTDTTE